MKTIKFLTILLCMIFVSCDFKVSESGDFKVSESRDSTLTTLNEAIQANDFETAHKLLAELPHWDYEEAAKKIFNAETQFLAVQGTDEANKRLLLLINEEPIEGSDRAEGQELKKNASKSDLEIEDVWDYDYQYHKYIKWCEQYNSKCIQIFDIALTLDNKQLAQMIIKAIKKDPGIESKLSEKKDGDSYYNIYAHHTTQTKDEAIAKYEEHFGKLNDNAEEDFGNLSDKPKKIKLHL